MAAILITVERSSRWDALLPVLSLLDGAGVELRAAFRGLRPPMRTLRGLAGRQGTQLPRVRWTRRRPRRGTVLRLGTTDDLDLLVTGGPFHFVAVPRLPVPAVVLGTPIPHPLEAGVAESRRSEAGRLLHAASDGSLPALAERVGGLPYLITGCPQLTEGEARLSRDAVVLLYGVDLAARRAEALEGVMRTSLRLQTVIDPLVKAGVSVELRSSEPAGHPRERELFTGVLEWLRERLKLPQRSLLGRSDPGWRDLHTAEAVLVLTLPDALRALVAGAERVYWAPFVLGSDTPRARGPLRDLVLPNRDAFLSWLRRRAWKKGSQAGRELAPLLRSLTDSGTTERVAQTVLTVLAEDTTGHS